MILLLHRSLNTEEQTSRLVLIHPALRTAMASNPQCDEGSAKDVGLASSRESDKLESQVSAVGTTHETAWVLDHQAERALCRKFDIRLLPILAVMCMSWLCPSAKLTA